MIFRLKSGLKSGVKNEKSPLILFVVFPSPHSEEQITTGTLVAMPTLLARSSLPGLARSRPGSAVSCLRHGARHLGSSSARGRGGRGSGRCVRVSASLEAVSLAASTQTFGLIAVLGGEAAYSVLAVPEGTSGRADAKMTGAACGGLLLSYLLIASSSAPLVYAGLTAGVACAGASAALTVKRVRDTESNPDDWPGPRAAPTLVAFACVLLLFTLVESYGAI